MLRGEAWGHKSSLTLPLSKVPVPNQESERSRICVFVISILLLSAILLLVFLFPFIHIISTNVQSRMDNPETQATLGTRYSTNQKIQYRKLTRGSQEPVIADLVFNLTSKVDRKWGCYP